MEGQKLLPDEIGVLQFHEDDDISEHSAAHREEDTIQHHAINNENKCHFDGQSTNVSATGNSMCIFEEPLTPDAQEMHEAEWELNIHRRKDSNQEKEKYKIELLAMRKEEERKKNQTQKQLRDFSVYQINNYDKQKSSNNDDSAKGRLLLLQEESRNNDSTEILAHNIENYKQKGIRRRTKWQEKRKDLFVQCSADLETSIWKKRDYNALFIDYQEFGRDNAGYIASFLAKERNTRESVNELVVRFRANLGDEMLLQSQISELAPSYSGLHSLSIDFEPRLSSDEELKKNSSSKNILMLSNNNRSLRELAYSQRFLPCNWHQQYQKNYQANLPFNLNSPCANALVTLITSSASSLQRLELTIPATSQQNTITLIKACLSTVASSLTLIFASAQVAIDSLTALSAATTALPTSLTLVFQSINAAVEQTLLTTLPGLKLSKIALHLNCCSLEKPIPFSNKLPQICTCLVGISETAKISILQGISKPEFEEWQRQLKNIPRQISKLHLSFKCENDDQVCLLPEEFKHLPQHLSSFSLAIDNTLDSEQTTKLSSIIAQLPHNLNALGLAVKDCDTDVLDQTLDLRQFPLVDISLSFQKNLYPEQLQDLLKMMPSCLSHLEIQLKELGSYESKLYNEQLSALSEASSHLNSLVIDCGTLSKNSSQILKNSLKYLRGSLTMLLAKPMDASAKKILNTIAKSDSTRVKLLLY